MLRKWGLGLLIVAAVIGVALVGSWLPGVAYQVFHQVLSAEVGPAPKPCNQLPPLAEAQAVLQDNEDLVQRVTAIRPEPIRVYVIDDRCPGKGEIIITHGGKEDGRKILELIGGDTIDDVPYRLHNI